MIKEALDYTLMFGISIMPVSPNKIPIIKWEEYQKRFPTETEIRKWWEDNPNANVGIITGKVSGIAVVDIDSEEANQKFTSTVPANIWANCPTVKTPRGYHYYFKHEEGITNTVNVMGQKIDIRGEGGYVVAPPSINEDGKVYKWLNPLKTDLPLFPKVQLGATTLKGITGIRKVEEAPKGIDPLESFDDGRRDEDLFHVANKLIRSGMPEDQVRNVIMRLALTCNPPFPEKVALRKVQSAIDRAQKIERNLGEETREWVRETSGWWDIRQCYGELQVNTTEEKGAVRKYVSRMKENNIVENHSSKHGWYRRIETECEPLDWENAPENDIPIWLPFDLHKILKIYPGNILVIAGWKDAGKTTFLLNFMKENMNKYEIHYFSSEMGASEFKLRLKLFKDMKLSDWIFKAHERQRNFADVIRPDAINIIDYIEIVGEQQYMIGKYLLDIHNNLKRGIAFVALQKPFGRDIARGGESSLDKPRLYLAMNPGQIKIISAKNRRGKENPNGLVLDFKLYQGSELYPQGFWRRAEE